MRFGKTAEEAAKEPSGGSGYIHYLKNGDTEFQILNEPPDWVYFWEHYNPGGFPFPCTNERDSCPGCTSDVEKMQKASRRIAFPVLQGENVVAFKVPRAVAEVLENRYNRNGTVCDRPFTISKMKGADATSPVYDIEGGSHNEVSVKAADMPDIEALLMDAYSQSWGDEDTAKQTKQKAEDAAAGRDLKSKIANAEKDVATREEQQTEDPPSEPEAPSGVAKGDEIVVTEATLREMSLVKLMGFLSEQGYTEEQIEEMGSSVDEIVSALL